MNTRNVLLFGAGFLLGYIITNSRKRKDSLVSEPLSTTDLSQVVPTETTGASIISEEVLEDPKITMCKEKWIKFAETRKFSSAEQEQSTYNNFMTSCVAQQ